MSFGEPEGFMSRWLTKAIAAVQRFIPMQNCKLLLNTTGDAMNKEDTIKAAAIMTAWAGGKKIQCRQKGDKQWIDDSGSGFSWRWDTYDYRVKPEEPRQVRFMCWEINNTLQWRKEGSPCVAMSKRHPELDYTVTEAQE